MDKYEKEFLEKVKQAAREMTVDRRELGEVRLKRFAAMIYRLIKEKNESFDLLVGGGNSGVAIIEIAKMIYEKAGIATPPILLLPVVRPSNQSNVQVDERLVREQLSQIDHVSRVLFLDDEIMLGQTAKICFESIADFFDKGGINSVLHCTIIAENHNFIWQYDLKNISVRFLPFARVLQGYNGNFGYLIPERILHDLEPILGAPIDRNKALAVLLGGKTKIIRDGVSFFDYEIEQKLKDTLPDYQRNKNEWREIIENVVLHGISEYSAGEITFRYLL